MSSNEKSENMGQNLSRWQSSIVTGLTISLFVGKRLNQPKHGSKWPPVSQLILLVICHRYLRNNQGISGRTPITEKRDPVITQ